MLKKRTANGGTLDTHTTVIHYTSTLDIQHREALEHLLFFNPQQHRYAQKISRIIDTTGVPKIIQQGEKLRVQVDSEHECQTIFAIVHKDGLERLVGLVMFVRQSEEMLLILHLAVEEAYSLRGHFSGQLLTFQLIEHVRRLARHIKGIQSVGIVYGRTAGQILKLPVK